MTIKIMTNKAIKMNPRLNLIRTILRGFNPPVLFVKTDIVTHIAHILLAWNNAYYLPT